MFSSSAADEITSVSKVYAGGGYNTDGSSGGSNTVSGTGSGGVSVNKTGVLFYCVDSKTGEVLSKYTFFSYNIKKCFIGKFCLLKYRI